MTVAVPPSSETSAADKRVGLSFTLELEPESPTALLRPSPCSVVAAAA
jgi:hypothetical protein